MSLHKRALAGVLALLCLIALAACGKTEPDPHEGMIYVNVGGAMDWLYPVEGLPVSDYKPEDFSDDGNVVRYSGEDYDARLGIDVSFYQGDIDWNAVRDFGVDFAMIRCGYRGYSEGAMVEDEKFRQNMEGAGEAGLSVGVYFFSQATGAVEAAEEALFVLERIKDYRITMPVAFDWEPIDGSRSSNVSGEDMTTAAVVFCEMMKDAGYQPCVYLYRHIAYYDYDLSRLTPYTLWVGAPGSAPDFYYAHDIWQFSFTSAVPGIDGDVDMDLAFTEKPEPSPEPPP